MENIITSKDNPTVKLYQKLSSSKKERLQYGLFVLEGLRIAEDALKEDSGITQLILTEKAAERWGDAEDLMGPAIFLASKASDFVNGHILYVDGGILAYIGKQP